MDSTNFLASLAVLQAKNLPTNTVVAASVAAAMVPGPMGLILPLAVASAGFGGTTTGSGDGAETMVRVPKVTGMSEEGATETLKGVNLNPVATSAYIDDDPKNQIVKGNVFQQDPAEGEFAAEGDDVNITVSLGPKTVGTTLDELRADVDAKFNQILQALGAAGTPPAGAPAPHAAPPHAGSGAHEPPTLPPGKKA